MFPGVPDNNGFSRTWLFRNRRNGPNRRKSRGFSNVDDFKKYLRGIVLNNLKGDAGAIMFEMFDEQRGVKSLEDYLVDLYLKNSEPPLEQAFVNALEDSLADVDPEDVDPSFKQALAQFMNDLLEGK